MALTSSRAGAVDGGDEGELLLSRSTFPPSVSSLAGNVGALSALSLAKAVTGWSMLVGIGLWAETKISGVSPSMMEFKFNTFVSSDAEPSDGRYHLRGRHPAVASVAHTSPHRRKSMIRNWLLVKVRTCADTHW